MRLVPLLAAAATLLASCTLERRPGALPRTKEPAVTFGLRTVKYPVTDLAKAKAFYTQAFGVAPYFDEPFYVGYNIGGFELGLDPDTTGGAPGPGGSVAYWGVEDITAALAHFEQAGARVVSAPQDVGGGIIVAEVADPFGNTIGLIRNPQFDRGAVR